MIAMKEKTLFIIPAYNEEFVTGKSLELALECKRLGIADEFILLNDRSEDRTAEVAQKRGAEVFRRQQDDIRKAAERIAQRRTKIAR